MKKKLGKFAFEMSLHCIGYSCCWCCCYQLTSLLLIVLTQAKIFWPRAPYVDNTHLQIILYTTTYSPHNMVQPTPRSIGQCRGLGDRWRKLILELVSSWFLLGFFEARAERRSLSGNRLPSLASHLYSSLISPRHSPLDTRP